MNPFKYEFIQKNKTAPGAQHCRASTSIIDRAIVWRRRAPPRCATQSSYALKSAMQPAITDQFSSLSGYFIGQRHQLVQAPPSFFVFVLILAFSRWALIPPPSA